ncbi:MAG: RNA polymerase subunit sigma-70, partial [Flavobacteriaceae bacterium]|nr:RNA polymerase subunit sigma-70 [Flavobacteriaceae bacterium]
MNKDLEHKFLIAFEAHQNIVHKICTLYAKDHDSHHDLFQE